MSIFTLKVDGRSHAVDLDPGTPLRYALCDDVVLLDHPESEAMGAGETSITLVAATIGNAVFDATGARLRQIPFSPENVKAALARRP
jgi:aerobic-type carbon monoxide dehydrogenase small subunit (CoxS/CutS family)